MWDIIQQFQINLLSSKKWLMPLEYYMLSSPDTLWVLLTRFAYRVQEGFLFFIPDVGGGCQLIVGFSWDDFEFHIWLLFLLLTPLACLLLSVGSWKKFEDRRKEARILLYSKFYFGFTTILLCGRFSWSLEVVMFPRQGVEIYQSFLVSCRFGVCPVGVSSEICLAEMAAYWRYC